MKDGICVKCQSDEVVVVLGNMQLLIANRRVALLDYYICADCGYTEMYVHKETDLNHIRKISLMPMDKHTNARMMSNSKRAIYSSDSIRRTNVLS